MYSVEYKLQTVQLKEITGKKFKNLFSSDCNMINALLKQPVNKTLFELY